MVADSKAPRSASVVDSNASSGEIARHRTAIRRGDLSKPVRTAVEDQLISEKTTVLDYGCGQGDDVRYLAALGVRCIGWDPPYQPKTTLCSSDVVNLGYVVNVIEDVEKRANVLKSAWEFAQQTLIVSARADGDPDTHGNGPLRDGCLTKIGTFKKFFQQGELREWIEGTLGYPAVAAAPGIFYVFRTDEQRHLFVWLLLPCAAARWLARAAENISLLDSSAVRSETVLHCSAHATAAPPASSRKRPPPRCGFSSG